MTAPTERGPLRLVPGDPPTEGTVNDDDPALSSTLKQQRATQDPLVGRTVAGRYRIEARLGAGAMGAVYRAEQVMLKKTVALKLLATDDDQDARERFLQEARIAATLKHPGIAEVYDFGVTEEGVLFYAMEYLQGTDLEHRLASRGPLPAEEAISIARDVAQALAVAHAAGVVHRDLKPANIFLVPQKVGGEAVKVVDFGISKIVAEGPAGSASRLTLPGFSCGTPVYMSPEQAAGQAVDARCDIYALGIVLYEMLCGRPPFDAPEAVRTLNMHLSEPPPAFASQCPGLQVPPELEAVVMRALAKKKEARFASMSDFDAALAAVGTRLGHPAVTAGAASDDTMPTGGRERDEGGTVPPRRSRLSLWLALAAVALLLGVGAALVSRGGSPAPSAGRLPDAGLAGATPPDTPPPAVVAPASAPQAGAAAGPRPDIQPPEPARKALPLRVRPGRAPAAKAPGPAAPTAPGPAPSPPQKGYRLDDLKPYGKKK
ncbi:MAG: serine/threonine protein kinase [Deltaproteobacteria bacterium]|nr:serine/threonine protein kinase [Deltaproteobacteria bacterium]